MKCELCRRQRVWPDCRLCEVCGEAIVRLTLICERIRALELHEAERTQKANEAGVVAAGHSLRAG